MFFLNLYWYEKNNKNVFNGDPVDGRSPLELFKK